MWFAIAGGLAPQGATKDTHGELRDNVKTCLLGSNYVMGALTLAFRINKPLAYAQYLLQLHHELFRTYWQWGDEMVNSTMLHNWQQTVFVWKYRLGDRPKSKPGRKNEWPNPRSIRNFFMQANGAEMLRIACCLGTEAGIQIGGTAHDGLIITAPLAELTAATAKMQTCMAEASRIVLNGFELRTEAQEVRYPDRYTSKDKEASAMWNTVMALLDSIESQNHPAPALNYAAY
jgi:hypothetical protein